MHKQKISRHHCPRKEIEQSIHTPAKEELVQNEKNTSIEIVTRAEELLSRIDLLLDSVGLA